jgi:predicted acyl esterase
MNAMNSKGTGKQLIFYITMLLFLFSAVSVTNAQYKIYNKPAGLNSWKPGYLLPRQLDNQLDVVRTDFTITMRDGVIIDCLKYVPVGTLPAGGWLTVIMHHGYGDHKETLAEFCRLQAEYGYYTMTFSVRGQGLSGGLSNLISTIEADDLIEIVDWIKADAVNGSNPDKILIMGGSQGGAVPMIAAVRGMEVAAIINSVAPPDFASSWIENGCAKMSLLWTVEYTPDTARYNGQVNRMSDWIYSDSKQYWDSLNYWMPRDRDFITGLQNITIPVLVEAAWQDKFFNANGWIQHIDKISNAPLTSYLGAVRGHGSDISYTEDVWHMNWFNNFFFQTLWGMQTTIFDEAKYQYASTKFPVVDNMYFSFVHDSSSVLMRNISAPLKLFLNKNGVLKTTAQTGNNTVTLKNSISNGYSLLQAVNDEFTGSNFTSKFIKDSVKFMTSALTTSLQWTGTPVVRLDYKSAAASSCQFNYQVYEVLPGGERRFINRANFTDRNYTKNSRRQVTFKGNSHSHRFQAGSRILIIITNLDKAHTDVEFFGTNPFVLPTMKNGSHTVYLSTNSYVELPVVNNNGNTPAASYFEDEANGQNTAAEVFTLVQNYPNPFNPATVIQYHIPVAEMVTIRVYDLLGREVKTIVNDVQSPGLHSVTFDASGLASGVYFYKLVSGGFTDVKRMLLIK